MHATELIEGHLYRKDDFITVEDDTDYIDDYVDETPYDKMLTEAIKNETQNETAPSSSSRYRNAENINEILQTVENPEMKNELEKWIYKYTEVFNDELSEQHAKVPAFSFETKNLIWIGTRPRLTKPPRDTKWW